MEKKVNMLTYNFENIGSDTLYQYLYKCIKNDIIQGKIKSGEKLPSKRALAKNLAISVITVENAYGQLAAEGYIYSVPKSGFYVVDLRDDKMKNESGLSENRIYSNKLNLTGGKNAYIADFTSNQTEQSAFPFSIWTKTMRAVMNDYQTELMLNPPCGGVMELRQSIADYLKAFRNMTVRPEQIIIGAGTEYLSSLLIQLLGKELKYSVENPGYHKIAKIYRSMGACYEYIEIEEDGPKVEELEEKEINVIHCSPSHHYPTGRVMPISKRYELLGWVTKTKDRYIIEDEYDSVMNDYQTELMLNPPCGGVMELRQSIADYLKAFRNMTVRPEQIIIGAGTEYLSSLLIQLLGKELKYSVENPGYHKIAKIYRSMGACYEYIEIEEDGPKVEELEEKEINVIHCSPSHHYPTGRVMPISKRYELLGWVTKTKDRYIIEDEYDSELRLNGKPIPSLQSIDVSGKVIYMNTFSKTLCSTVRISYMVLPDELAERFYRELSFYSCTVSNFEQYTLAQFMNSGAFEKHINRLRNYYQQKRDRILEAFLQGVLKTKIKILEEDAGVHFLMKVDTNLSEEEFLDKMKSKGIKLAALSSYYHSSEKKKKYENIYVMNYSFVDCEKMEYVAKMITQVE